MPCGRKTRPQNENGGFFVVPLNSVNTNASALMALQALNAVNRELSVTYNRISTGKRVSSAKDDPATWAIAQYQRSQSRALDAVQASLQRGQSAVDVALSAGETISDLLNDMKETVLAASDSTITAEAKAALSDRYVALRRQIDNIANNAEFAGLNLIGGGTGAVKALANANGTDFIDVAHVDLSTGGAALTGIPADLTGAIGQVEIDAMSASIRAVNGGLAKLGSGANALDRHLTFVSKLQDTYDEGIGRLVDADMAKEAARFQALQVKQQLAIQALQIAVSAPSMLLQLFQRR